MLYNKPNFLYRYCITEGKMEGNLPKPVVKRKRKESPNNLFSINPILPPNSKDDKRINSFQPKNPDKKQRASNTISVENH